MGEPKSLTGHSDENIPPPIESRSAARHLVVNHTTSCPGDVMSDVSPKLQAGWFCYSAFFLGLQNGVMGTTCIIYGPVIG
jgi:hypothetical protein